MRKFHIPADLKHRYHLQAPSGKKRIYRIKRFEAGAQTAVVDPRLASINKNYLAGALTAAEARSQVELLIEALYRADGVKVSRYASNTANDKIIAKYLAAVIVNRKTKAISKQSLGQYLRRGAAAVGELSLLTTDVAELQQAIDKAYPDQRQRQIVTYLNSVLKWLGRTERLEPHRKVPRDVRYLPLDLLPQLLPALPNDAWRVLVQLAAYTGLRIGELFALDARSKLPHGLKVDWQIDRDGQKVMPKNNKRRTVAVFPQAVALLSEWQVLKATIGAKERVRAADIVRTACLAVYPNNPEWHLKFHDLRHTYAVACCDKGMSLEWLAKQLGDRLEVAEEYYAGFVQSDNSLAAASALLRG